MTDREAMQMALTVLERTYKMDSNDPQFQAVKALCTALAQPEKKELVGLTGQEVKKIFKDCGMSYSSVHLAMQIEARLKDKNT